MAAHNGVGIPIKVLGEYRVEAIEQLDLEDEGYGTGKGLRHREEMSSSWVLGEEEKPTTKVAGLHEEGSRRCRSSIE
ncbi:hypothetical protein B296_00057929 [Ensete ventricosum]|uniref:Uncharacterized protein n=1 Tax=Ensete ventricosum TaxID=4639 RepID=A0A426XPC1_ENSVE|nr:hypothetical protein B296_00057929 [Ensete ventricosum]